MEIQFMIKAGLSRQISDKAHEDVTIRQLLANASYQAILKHGENTDAIVNGVIQSHDTTLGALGDNVTINLETRSNSKA